MTFLLTNLPPSPCGTLEMIKGHFPTRISNVLFTNSVMLLEKLERTHQIHPHVISAYLIFVTTTFRLDVFKFYDLLFYLRISE